MAKNTSSSAFRKIDIDQYNEDNFREDEAEQSIPTGPDDGEVCSLLNQYCDDGVRINKKLLNMADIMTGDILCGYDYFAKGRYIDALKHVLTNAPIGTPDQQVKDNALTLTLKVLLAIKSGQIEEAVGSLSLDDIDILMKYIYRGFEYPSEGSSGHLLLWHEKAYNIGGAGSIVRVLSDRLKV